MSANKMYFGDCLTVLRDKMNLASVDLVYLDPPFNSQRAYNNIYKDETGRPLPSQIHAFNDTWTLDAEQDRIIRQMPVLMREKGIADSVATFWRHWMEALRGTNEPLLAYLSYMVERLLWIKGTIKPTGSVFLHCDPTASHYIKVMMDAIFGHGNFRNEIVWKRTSAHNSAKRCGPIHDVILSYSVSDKYVWNQQHQAYDPDYVENFYTQKDKDGRRFRLSDLTAPGERRGETGQTWRGINPTDKGRHWIRTPSQLETLEQQGRITWPSKGVMPRYKRYLDEMPGIPLQDIWMDIKPIQAHAKERLGYATQKPVALLERIIAASSNEGDVVLDPFCGCGTTLEAAHKLKRRWIGIDIASHAINRVSAIRLQERLGLKEGEDFTIDGIPQDIEGARHLWQRDPFNFQTWAVDAVEGYPTSQKTADGGVDGRLFFELESGGQLESMIVEVKGGQNVGIQVLRSLLGVLEAGDALMAGLILLEPLGERKDRNFRSFMAKAGDLEVKGRPYAKMQMLTIADILDGKRFDTPYIYGKHGDSQLRLV